MKFLTKTAFIFSFLLSLNAHAISILKGAEESFEHRIYVTSYADYFPFGYHTDANNDWADNLGSVFRDAITETKAQDNGPALSYIYFDTLHEAILDMKTGKTHVFLGAFYATTSFEDFEFVFPAILNNPIHLMMLPDRINEVKTVEDLKNLKGVYVKTEMFSTYMLNVFEDLSLTPVENTDEAYRQLLVGDIDFILGSFYYQYIKVLETGLKGYIAFSSHPLWKMPMFIALSKRLENRKAVSEYFRKIILEETFKETILARIKQTIEEKEEEFLGAVPPMYIKERNKTDLTPADEMLKENEE